MPIGRWMDHEVVYIYTMGYYLAIKKNASESVLIKWLELELIIQTETEKWKWKSLSHFQLFATPWTIESMEFQARILEWVTYPFSSRSSLPRNQTGVSCIAGGFFTNWAIREALIQREVSQKEKHQNSILTHVWNVERR